MGGNRQCSLDGRLLEFELVQKPGVSCRTTQETFLGKLFVVDEGDKLFVFESRIFVVQQVKNELVGSFFLVDKTRNQDGSLQVGAGIDGIGFLKVGLDVCAGIRILERGVGTSVSLAPRRNIESGTGTGSARCDANKSRCRSE